MDGIIHIKIHLIFIMVPWGGGGDRTDENTGTKNM